jgi:hypothetical protein
MSTIVTRAGKGSALTWTEGDANITNLNTDKLENITSESIGDLSDVDLTGIADGNALVWNNANSKFQVGNAGASAIADLGDVIITTPSSGQVLTYMPSGQWENQTVGGGSFSPLSSDLDVSTHKITSTSQNYIQIGGYQYPNSEYSAGGGAGAITGAISMVSAPMDTLTFAPGSMFAMGDAVVFNGTNVINAGLMAGQTYYIGMSMGADSYTISSMMAGTPTVDIQDPGSFTDFQYSVTSNNASGSTPTMGDVLTYGAGGVLSFTTPSSGASSAWMSDVNGGSFTLSNVNFKEYRETVYDLGTNGYPMLDLSFGNVQKLNTTSGLTLQNFMNAQQGQSLTLIVTGSGAVTDMGGYKFAGGNRTLTNFSVITIFYDGMTYWASISTDFQ